MRATASSIAIKKAKLPRKRKKACIKAMGREWYYLQIRLHETCVKNGTCVEKVCKFWNNDSLKPRIFMVGGSPVMIKVATRFW